MSILAALAAATLAAAPTPAAPREDGVAAEITRLVEAAARADLAGDAAFYEKLLAPDFTLGTSQGELLGREEKLAGFRSGLHRIEREVLSDVRVRLYGRTTAIATLTATIAWRYGAEHGERTVLFTQTFVRDAGAWRLVASHGSEVRAARAEKARESAP
jgi:uncharacterized protein (TIGR02246 family)